MAVKKKPINIPRTVVIPIEGDDESKRIKVFSTWTRTSRADEIYVRGNNCNIHGPGGGSRAPRSQGESVFRFISFPVLSFPDLSYPPSCPFTVFKRIYVCKRTHTGTRESISKGPRGFFELDSQIGRRFNVKRTSVFNSTIGFFWMENWYCTHGLSESSLILLKCKWIIQILNPPSGKRFFRRLSTLPRPLEHPSWLNNVRQQFYHHNIM